LQVKLPIVAIFQKLSRQPLGGGRIKLIVAIEEAASVSRKSHRH
jgi:molybdenum-dependent DNA-binding transcriptional regulator ModE